MSVRPLRLAIFDADEPSNISMVSLRFVRQDAGHVDRVHAPVGRHLVT